MPIQFLIYNCSAHNEKTLVIQDPNVTTKYLPPNTTSLIQPMDQAVLNSVKSHQKKEFYFSMFKYCEEHYFETSCFNDFLKKYTILDAIYDIFEGWSQVPKSTIQKSFRKVFPQDKWAQVTGVDIDEPPFDFEGFEDSDRCQPIPIDNLPGAMDIEHTQLVNADFDTNIELIVDKLNSHSYFRFNRGAVIEDVLLNPGPKDDNTDNIA